MSGAPIRLWYGRSVGTAPPIVAEWLGRIGYREAWARQKALLEQRAAGEIDDTILLLEHDPVLTLGREADEAHVLASPRELRRRGIEVIRVERGGEVTYHGPGQLVAYPIIRLGDRGILVRPLVAALEAAMIETCSRLGVEAMRRDGHPGCWIEDDPGRGRPHRKIGALGLRIERGVSYHGIALNIDVDLRDFDLIDPCGDARPHLDIGRGRARAAAPSRRRPRRSSAPAPSSPKPSRASPGGTARVGAAVGGRTRGARPR